MAGADRESIGLFYADGHVRVYHGSLTDLPRRYVARERLCLRGTTDYWINGLDGAPFLALPHFAWKGCRDVTGALAGRATGRFPAA
jgi:hypothetical protein